MALLIDVDSHVYEPAAIWDEYVPAKDRDRAKKAFHHSIDDQGNRTTTLNGQPAKDLNRSMLVRQALWKPGMTVEEIGQLDPQVFQPLNPGAANAKARLVDMDAMGVDQALVFPTLFAEYLPLVEDEEAAVSLARAYNDWVWDMASDGNGRIHPVALLPLQSLDGALQEIERVTAKGFKSVVLRPAFYKITEERAAESFTLGNPLAQPGLADGSGRVPVFIEDKPFRVIYERLDKAGLVACIHPSSGIAGPDAVSSGGFAERVSSRLGIAHSLAEPVAYMQDANLFATAALFHGLLEDLPDLRIAILHSGATWVPLALEKAETYLWLGSGLGSLPVCLEPEEVWDRHPLVVAFDSWERPVARMPDLLGDKAAWGSRYPHHDAAGPDEARAMLEEHGVDAARIDRLLGGNAADLFGLK